MGYRATRVAITLMLSAYVLVAVAGNILTRDAEFYPVFSWSLFSNVSDLRATVELEIVAMEGEPLPEPKTYYEMKHLFRQAARSNIDVTKSLWQLGDLIANGEETQELASAIHRKYLSEAEIVSWRLVRVLFDPIERYRTGAILSRDVVFETTTLR